MNEFIQHELFNMLDGISVIRDLKPAGDIAIGTIGPDLRLRAEFINRISNVNYDALKLTIINRVSGPVDMVVLSFDDVWGAKKTNNPNFPEGVSPHFRRGSSASRTKTEWYVYVPTAQDYNDMRAEVINYVSAFAEI